MQQPTTLIIGQKTPSNQGANHKAKITQLTATCATGF
jgi:hypothetical protein